MDTLPSIEIITKIAQSLFLQNDIKRKVETTLGSSSKEDTWEYEVIGKGLLTTTFLITLRGKRFALKISDSPKFTQDTEREKWLYDTHRQNTPKIFSSGEGMLPGMNGKFFWSVQEYIPGVIWENIHINDPQLDSFIHQLTSLHGIQSDNDTTRWGKIKEGHIGENETFEQYVATYMDKIQRCNFFSVDNRGGRIQTALGKLRGNLRIDQPILIHNDAHPGNVIIDSEISCRLIDFGNIKWSYPEEELAVIKTHCVGSRMYIFDQIIAKYKEKAPRFDEQRFQFFLLLNACTKITTRKEVGKQEFLWKELIEPILVNIGV